MNSFHDFLNTMIIQMALIAGFSTMFVWMVTVAGRGIGGKTGLYVGAAVGVSITSTPFAWIMSDLVSAWLDPARWTHYRVFEHWPITLAIALAAIAPIVMLCCIFRQQLALAKRQA